jgi:DNA topoisomerase-1
MRTDAVHIAPEAIAAARAYIQQHFGPDYLPEQPRIYASKKTAQEAHEAIRPTSLQRAPDQIRQHLSADQYKLYLLIWRRFIASQMNPAIYDTISADIETDQGLLLRVNGSVIKFQGYLAAYEEKRDPAQQVEEEETHKLLPSLTPQTPLTLQRVEATQSFTKPPPRFTEASLVKELERLGIGRPSTYASIMHKIQSREYTTKEGQALRPTELGRVICVMLEQNFPPIMDVTFTAQMEDQLEQVAAHNKDWKELLRHFWRDFLPLVERAEKEAQVPKIDTDRICPQCGHHLQKIWSRSKYFFGCSNYPACPFTAPLEALDFNKADYDPQFDWDQSCPQCGASMILRHGKFGPFLGCSKYPDCKGIVNIPKKGELIYKPEEMPPCPALGCDGRMAMRKSRFGKTFFSCSNYPECDVIVSTLDQLEAKYDAHHPKTAYVKKRAGKRDSKRSRLPPKKRGAAQVTYRLSDALAQIVGLPESTRPEVTRKVWDYIKAHHLQDPHNKRRICPDAKLAQVIGKEPIDMMQLAKALGKHFLSSSE